MALRAITFALALLAVSAAQAQVPGLSPYANMGPPPIGTPASLATVVNSAGNSTTCILTLTADIQPTDFVVVGTALPSNTLRTVTAVADSGAVNSYTSGVAVNDGASFEGSLWISKATTRVASGGSITVTFSAATTGSNGWSCFAYRVRGTAFVTSPLDKTGSQNASTATPSVTLAALAQANEIVFGFSYQTGGANTFTEASGYTNLVTLPAIIGGTGGKYGFGYKIVGATTGPTYNPTWNVSRQTFTMALSARGLLP